LTVQPGDHLKTLRHGVTRFRITLECHEARYETKTKKTQAASSAPSAVEMQWLTPAELEHYPLNSTGRELAGLLNQKNCKNV
jgi:A/G-specific adenine glycosylase